MKKALATIAVTAMLVMGGAGAAQAAPSPSIQKTFSSKAPYKITLNVGGKTYTAIVCFR